MNEKEVADFIGKSFIKNNVSLEDGLAGLTIFLGNIFKNDPEIEKQFNHALIVYKDFLDKVKGTTQ